MIVFATDEHRSSQKDAMMDDAMMAGGYYPQPASETQPPQPPQDMGPTPTPSTGPPQHMVSDSDINALLKKHGLSPAVNIEANKHRLPSAVNIGTTPGLPIVRHSARPDFSTHSPANIFPFALRAGIALKKLLTFG